MKNKKSKKRKHAGGEPDVLGMALSASRKRKPGNEDGVPTLFKEDVGDDGLKTKRDSTTREGSSFDIRLTKEEKRRRKERQVRCEQIKNTLKSRRKSFFRAQRISCCSFCR